MTRSGAFVGFELLLFVLTMVKFVEAYRNGWDRIPLLTLVVRDGTWAFLVIFGSCGVALICGIIRLTVRGHSRYLRQCRFLFRNQRPRIISRHRVRFLLRSLPASQGLIRLFVPLS